MQHRIILPGATTLTRLISEVREKATLRLWNKLALIPSAEQRSQLEMLLGPTDCSRLSLLESLKKGPVTISGPAFNEAIERWKTLNDFGLHAENLSTLPAVRLKNLARYAGMTSVLHYQSDVMMNGAILLALGLSWYGWHRADALFALGIGIYILYSALRMGYEAVQSLLDRALPDEERQEIIDIVTSWPGVSGAHDLRTRQSGPTRFIQIHLEMEDSLPLVQAHMVADQVEQAILRRFPGSDVIIHQDPCSVVPREGKRSMLS